MVLDAMQASHIDCKSFVDDNEISSWAGLSVLKLSDLVLESSICFHLAIGNCKTREALAINLIGAKYFSVTHLSAVISKTAQIGLGTFSAAQSVIAPGANINYNTGHAIFEATHGTAPKYAGQDKVNPGSLILSGAMMLEYMGWQKAADLIYTGLEKAIASKRVTYDFERLMQGATLLKCSEFGKEIVKNM